MNRISSRISTVIFIALATRGIAAAAVPAGGGTPRGIHPSMPPPDGPAGQISVTVRRIVVPSEAVARIADAVGLDLDGLTGRVVLAPEETKRLLARLGSESSAVVMGEGSCLGRAGENAVARSTRTMTYEVAHGGQTGRDLGSMFSVCPQLGTQGLIRTTMAVEHVAFEGSVRCGRGKSPRFETFSIQTSCALRNGGSILLRGARSTHWQINREGGKKGIFPADYFMVVTARLHAGQPAGPEEPPQAFVACRMFDLGPKGIGGLRGILGAGGGETATPLTVQQYRDLDRLVRQSGDSAPIWLASVVAQPAQEASLKWVQEDVQDNGSGAEVREIGCMFTAVARVLPDGKGVSVQMRPELVMPAHPGPRAKAGDRQAPFEIAVPMTVDVEPGRIMLSPATVPEDFLRKGHRCYMVLTARMLGAVPSAPAPIQGERNPEK